MGLTYGGSKRIGEIFPSLQQSLSTIQNAVTLSTQQKQSAQAEIDRWHKRLQAAQQDLDDMSALLQTAQGVLAQAEALLNQANGVISALGNSLNQAGLHLIHYTGPFHALGTKLALVAVDKQNYPNLPGSNDCVYAFVVVASDGGAVQSIIPILGSIANTGSTVDTLGQQAQQIWANIAGQLNDYAALQEGNPGGTPTNPVPTQPPAANACDSLLGGA